MKHIKAYENMTDSEISIFGELMRHLKMIFNDLGYSDADFSEYDNGRYKFSVEFFKNTKYKFSIQIFDILRIFLIFKPSVNKDSITDFIPEYLKTIIDLKFNEENDFQIVFTINAPTNKIKRVVNNIINQITIEDFEEKLNAYKYNL